MSLKFLIPVQFECDGYISRRCDAKVMGTAACVENADNQSSVAVPVEEPKLPPGWCWFHGDLLCDTCAKELDR